MARKERRYGKDELRRGMYSEDGTCLCCFLHCPPILNNHAWHYPCKKALREYSYDVQVLGHDEEVSDG